MVTQFPGPRLYTETRSIAYKTLDGRKVIYVKYLTCCVDLDTVMPMET
jgi:hypothetical protein